MTRKDAKEIRWLVVQVWRGIPTEVEVYRSLRTARRRERLLRERINIDQDEIGLFRINCSTDAAELCPSLAPTMD